jgi:hypothetical protein
MMTKLSRPAPKKIGTESIRKSLRLQNKNLGGLSRVLNILFSEALAKIYTPNSAETILFMKMAIRPIAPHIMKGFGEEVRILWKIP